MKRQFMKSVVSILMMMTMAFTSVGNVVTVNADDSLPTIDFSKKGSISVSKKANGVEPLNKVEFSGVKVADITQSTTGVRGITYTLTTVGKSIFTDLAAKDTVTSIELDDALREMSAMDRSKYDKTAITNASGIAKFSDLDLGVYIIEETDHSNAEYADGTKAEIASGVAPFLVMVPQTNEDGDKWEYDRAIIAKNLVDDESIDKSVTGEHVIEDEDGLTAAIGSTVWYTLTGSISRVTDVSKYIKYQFSDEISEGLTYGVKGDERDDFAPVVKIGETVLTVGTDYTLTLSPNSGRANSFVISFTETGVNKVNEQALKTDGTGATSVTVTYPAHLNDNAIQKTGENEATLTYQHKGGTESEKKDTEELIPLELDIEKLFDNINVEDLPEGIDINATKVTFTLKYVYEDEQGNEAFKDVYVRPIHNSPGQYVADFSVTSDGNGYSRVFACCEKGKARVYGLPKGKYILTELTTVDGYNLLAKDIEILLAMGDSKLRSIDKVMSEAEANQIVEKYILDNYGDIADGGTLLAAFQVLDAEVDGVPPSSVESTEECTDEDCSEITTDEPNGGKVTVNNEKSPAFELPSTGGMGTFVYTIAGVLLMSGAGLLYIILNKKSKRY